MYIPRINSGLKSEVLCLHKLHHATPVNLWWPVHGCQAIMTQILFQALVKLQHQIFKTLLKTLDITGLLFLTNLETFFFFFLKTEQTLVVAETLGNSFLNFTVPQHINFAMFPFFYPNEYLSQNLQI